jgi:hypothetical protein
METLALAIPTCPMSADGCKNWLYPNCSESPQSALRDIIWGQISETPYPYR